MNRRLVDTTLGKTEVASYRFRVLVGLPSCLFAFTFLSPCALVRVGLLHSVYAPVWDTMPLITKTPYAGAEQKLVVAIDVGTTFSAVSFCVLRPGEEPQFVEVHLKSSPLHRR
jgi:hypothetical protein